MSPVVPPVAPVPVSLLGGVDEAGAEGVVAVGALGEVPVGESSGVTGSVVPVSSSPGSCGSSEPGAVSRSNSWAGEERRAASV